MGLNKARGQSEYVKEVMFVLDYTGGTPAIASVCPPSAAGDISVADTAAGQATVTIKNMKGPQGATNIQVTPRNHFTVPSAESRSYSGDDLSFVVRLGDADLDDSSAGEDVDADVRVVAY